MPRLSMKVTGIFEVFGFEETVPGILICVATLSNHRLAASIVCAEHPRWLAGLVIFEVELVHIVDCNVGHEPRGYHKIPTLCVSISNRRTDIFAVF